MGQMISCHRHKERKSKVNSFSKNYKTFIRKVSVFCSLTDRPTYRENYAYTTCLFVQGIVNKKLSKAVLKNHISLIQTDIQSESYVSYLIARIGRTMADK